MRTLDWKQRFNVARIVAAAFVASFFLQLLLLVPIFTSFTTVLVGAAATSLIVGSATARSVFARTRRSCA